MKLSMSCLLLLFCGTLGQFQPEHLESGDVHVVTLLQDFQAQLDEQKQQLEDQKNQIDAMMKQNGQGSNQSLTARDCGFLIHTKNTLGTRLLRICSAAKASLTEDLMQGESLPDKRRSSHGIRKRLCFLNMPFSFYSIRCGRGYRSHTDGRRDQLPVSAHRASVGDVLQDGVQGTAYMYGAEYQMSEHDHANFASFPTGFAQDVPCAVCYVPTRGSELMIPARNTCPTGWIKEYDGYLMASKYYHAGAKEYVCVDGQPEIIPGGDANQNGALFYLVEARCGSLPCPSYVEGRELTCVVCTK
uniref:Short-chain collagen C4-like n=1 Tax=Branchiostoma floridae TaxID=7739 RepID=C3YCP8_BRAFL|eukprot:XP_002605839.1 hypothetical protein BRAFLDRAFT_84324 [Branchiostoma floridae]